MINAIIESKERILYIGLLGAVPVEGTYIWEDGNGYFVENVTWNLTHPDPKDLCAHRATIHVKIEVLS